jgi:hypothetical protein
MLHFHGLLSATLEKSIFHSTSREDLKIFIKQLNLSRIESSSVSVAWGELIAGVVDGIVAGIVSAMAARMWNRGIVEIDGKLCECVGVSS